MITHWELVTRPHEPGYALNRYCRYSLYLLPKCGTCPECGTGYESRVPDVQAALAAFNGTIPGWWRLGIRCKSTEWDGARVGAVTIVMSAVVSAVFFYAQVEAVRVGVSLIPKNQGVNAANIIVEYGSYWHRAPVRPYAGTLVFMWLVVFLGQLAVGGLVWVLYARASRRVPTDGDLVMALGTQATISVPVLLLFPMASIVIWQGFNVRFPMGRAGRSFRIPFASLWDPFDRYNYGTDLLQLVGFVALLVSCAFVGFLLYRTHRRAIRRVCFSLGEVTRKGLT